MSSILYQTFYPDNKFDHPDDCILKLSKWMLTKDALLHIFPKPEQPTMQTVLSKQSSVSVSPSPSKRTFIIPDKMDTLFWCMYISHYGEPEYLAIGNKYGNAEIAEKQKITEYLKVNKYIFKNMNKKITLGASQEIMSELMTNLKTNLQTLIALSVFYKKNILLLNTNNNTYIEYLLNKDDDVTSDRSSWVVIKYTDNKKYGIVIDDGENIKSFITDKMIPIELPDKPLKGISTYTIGKLNEIANTLPDFPKEKLTKPELYAKIWHHCLWT